MISLAALLTAPGIENYPNVFPRLSESHPKYLGDPSRSSPADAARILSEAGRHGPVDPAEAAKLYRDRGELDSLRAVAPDQVTPATAQWQRQAEVSLGQAEEHARLCDRERVPCPSSPNWERAVNELARLLAGEFAGTPGAVCAMVARAQDDMLAALVAEKERLRTRLKEIRARLTNEGAALDADATTRAGELIDRVGRHIDADDLFLAVQRLADLDALLASQVVTSTTHSGRKPLPTRVNPFSKTGCHFELVVAAAKNGTVDARGLRRFLPDADAVTQAADAKEFLALHSTRQTLDWSPYFSALSRWLGAGEHGTGRARRLTRPDTPNLEPKGKLSGRWVFLRAEGWQGTPFYDDADARPRLLAVVRLGIADADRAKPRVVANFVVQTLQELITLDPVTEDESRFRHDGLIVVLLPGDILGARPYDQFRRDIQLDARMRPGRIAYLDDVDLLRLLPVRPDDRYRGFLELALPRFPDAPTSTYQDSDAVRPRMFFGRTDELNKLENGVTVVFSGRRMGKSSLLRRLQAQCGPDTTQRAVMVGCSAIGVGRSGQLLTEIERELTALLHRERGNTGNPPLTPTPAPTTDPAADLERAKIQFRIALDSVLGDLAALGVRQLYVLLDEADNFIRAEMEENSGRRNPRGSVSWSLKDLQTITHVGRLRFIFAGYDQLGRVFRDPSLGESAFGHWGASRPLNLETLDPHSARALVVEPLTALGMPVSEDMADRILDYTSGHASLIQVFGRRLVEAIREREPDWPLNDVAVRFEHLVRIADEDRGADNYRQVLEQTLGLNLDIARAYPLRLVFLALVSPTGLGCGRILGADPFAQADALEQVRGEAGAGWPELSERLVADSLDLLVQLGLLKEVEGPPGERAFKFRAWHYVTVLRTRSLFRDELRRAAADWEKGGRRLAAEPRCVWTLPDTDLHTLRRVPSGAPAVLLGLPKSGREYAAAMLSSRLADGTAPLRFDATQPDFADAFAQWLSGPDGQFAVVTDFGDAVPWEATRERLREALGRSRPLRWVGGPRLAWELAGDVELRLELPPVVGLGPLTAAELEPWTARRLGGDGPGSAAVVSPTDADAILLASGGLLPTLELFREWLLSRNGFPDPLTKRHVEDYFQDLKDRPSFFEKTVARMTDGVPVELRAGLQQLFRGAREYGYTAELPRELMETSEELKQAGFDHTTRVLDAGRWLGFVSEPNSNGQVRVPYDSVLGMVVLHPRFANP